MAPKEVLVIHCSLAISRRNGSSCHWFKTSYAERVGLPLCTGLLTIKLSHTGQFCNSSPITDLSLTAVDGLILIAVEQLCIKENTKGLSFGHGMSEPY